MREAGNCCYFCSAHSVPGAYSEPVSYNSAEQCCVLWSVRTGRMAVISRPRMVNLLSSGLEFERASQGITTQVSPITGLVLGNILFRGQFRVDMKANSKKENNKKRIIAVKLNPSVEL
ncbi:hypothetical protein JTE90_010417 [Oedothorax gibbosus]|uniref:Uncharacterized protein n=1 Tax=Oedothorax gibbosus TaxID=931172 RepID=A0AAV6W3R7_9ARAC|nr:hypothetical protein JTE90_010417 [Oedothorax gibbosus]